MGNNRPVSRHIENTQLPEIAQLGRQLMNVVVTNRENSELRAPTDLSPTFKTDRTSCRRESATICPRPKVDNGSLWAMA